MALSTVWLLANTTLSASCGHWSQYPSCKIGIMPRRVLLKCSIDHFCFNFLMNRTYMSSSYSFTSTVETAEKETNESRHLNQHISTMHYLQSSCYQPLTLHLHRSPGLNHVSRTLQFFLTLIGQGHTAPFCGSILTLWRGGSRTTPTFSVWWVSLICWAWYSFTKCCSWIFSFCSFWEDYWTCCGVLQQ